MKINYDKKMKIAGIGLVPWTRLGPDLWFDSYKIASLNGWDINDFRAPQVFALNEYKEHVVLPKLNSQALIENSEFQSLVTDNLAGYSLLTYKPIIAPQVYAESGIKFLNSNIEIAPQIENKASFRRMFTPLGVHFPAYEIYDRQSLDATQRSFEVIMKNRLSVILQDSVLSGGIGTFTVDSIETLDAALVALADKQNEIVISDKIESSFERTVQCVVTKYGTFVGPSQKQIVANPLLAHLDDSKGDKFCGAEISEQDVCAESYGTIKKQALAIGKVLFNMGYRGIFGLDCLVKQNGEVFVLEVNPRITGVTPLVTMIQQDKEGIPFYLLHVLELLNADYTIDDIEDTKTASEGSLLVLHSQEHSAAIIERMPSSGIYDKNLIKISDSIRFGKNDNERYIVQRYHPIGSHIKPGGRLLSVMSDRRVLNNDDSLNEETRKHVKQLYTMFRLEGI